MTSRLLIEPQKLAGSLTIQPSKSLSHRALICAALAKGNSLIKNLGTSVDITATQTALKSLGLAKFTETADGLLVQGGLSPVAAAEVDCRESGSTLRFLLPLAAALGIEVLFTGQGRLLERPLGLYLEALNQGGAQIKRTQAGLLVTGQLQAGTYRLAGNVSSQYISGLMLALPLLAEDSQIEIIGSLQSVGYVRLTEEVLHNFSACLEWEKQQIIIRSGAYQAADFTVEGDWSHAAFFLAAGLLGSDIICGGLNTKSLQGDRDICRILVNMGGQMERLPQGLKMTAATLSSSVIDACQVPDLVPPLAVAACKVTGTTTILGAQRLRIKESDRLAAVADLLNTLGGEVRETTDGLVIKGRGYLQGGRVSAWGDHRIAMSAAVAATICRQPLLLSEWQCVSKSAPQFWQEYAALGGVTHERFYG